MKNKAKNSKLSNKSVILILGLIYTLITILAVISYVSTMNDISSTPVTVGSVFVAMWWQILMIILFVVTYILYVNKQIMASLLEVIMGMAMLVYIIITVCIMGINILALFIELIYPLTLILHGLIALKKVRKKLDIKKSTI